MQILTSGKTTFERDAFRIVLAFAPQEEERIARETENDEKRERGDESGTSLKNASDGDLNERDRNDLITLSERFALKKQNRLNGREDICD